MLHNVCFNGQFMYKSSFYVLVSIFFCKCSCFNGADRQEKSQVQERSRVLIDKRSHFSLSCCALVVCMCAGEVTRTYVLCCFACHKSRVFVSFVLLCTCHKSRVFVSIVLL